jgi:hypothetical protein
MKRSENSNGNGNGLERERETEFPPVFTHSVKIEQSAKGARVTVHVSPNEAQDAIQQAIDLSTKTRGTLEAINEVVAPVEHTAAMEVKG